MGFTDSEITGMEDPSVIGNQAPLVSDVTYNVGAQWRQPISGDLAFTFRADYQHVEGPLSAAHTLLHS